MTAVKLQNIDLSFCSAGRNAFRPAQHGQTGPTPPASHASADQDDTQPLSPGSLSSDASLPDHINSVRHEQQVDLAMLRLSFRKLILPEDKQDDFDEQNANNPVRLFTASEFSNLVSAVTRVHSDERETFGIHPPDQNQSDEQSELRRLESLTLAELFDLCRREGISPPNPCQTPPKTSDPDCNGQT